MGIYFLVLCDDSIAFEKDDSGLPSPALVIKEAHVFVKAAEPSQRESCYRISPGPVVYCVHEK